MTETASTEAETTTRETFDITITGHYNSWEIPPRCRKAREVQRETTTVVKVPVVAPENVPVVITDLRASKGFEVDYRLFNGDLYTRNRLNHGDRRVIVAGTDDYQSEIDERSGWDRGTGSSPEEFARERAKSYRHDIVIDGEVWSREEEPRYVVQTMGLGGNHGGTFLDAAGSDNPNIKANRYFRADQFAEAQEQAILVAENRGDEESIPRIRKTKPAFEVHLPDALRLVVPPVESKAVRDARAELHTAAREYADILDGKKGSDAAEAAAFLRLRDARADLSFLTDNLTSEASERRPYEEGRTSIWA